MGSGKNVINQMDGGVTIPAHLFPPPCSIRGILEGRKVPSLTSSLFSSPGSPEHSRPQGMTGWKRQTCLDFGDDSDKSGGFWDLTVASGAARGKVKKITISPGRSGWSPIQSSYASIGAHSK